MLVLGRGHTTYTEVPDSPAGSPTITRSSTAVDTPAASDHTTPDLNIARAELFVPALPLTTSDGATGAPSIPWFAHFESPVQSAPVASVVTDLYSAAVTRGDLSGPSGLGDGDIIGRGSDLGPLGVNVANYSDHGWFIVPSASNEYGDTQVAGDGFVFDVAAGEFTADWFFV